MTILVGSILAIVILLLFVAALALHVVNQYEIGLFFAWAASQTSKSPA
ncbi:hypothetical protein [Arthrobacter psychrochitiniphilus]|nr:hypothetical protein [Arthrobacter psychrochitiniphilus]NYG17122.1 hypothetical protein [Arthrobacter psychrochitiniphilus]